MAAFISTVTIDMDITSPVITTTKEKNIRRWGRTYHDGATAAIHVSNTSGEYSQNCRAHHDCDDPENKPPFAHG